MSDSRFAGRTVLITGGARGLGASHAERFAAEGARVVIGDVLDAEGDAVAKRLGEQVTYRHLDVTSADDWAAAVGGCQDRGRLDVIVNNAGIMHVCTVEQQRRDDWDRVLAVNVTGTLLGMQSAIPALRETGRGAIVNTASIFGPAGAAGFGAYCASKAAIIAMTKTAALELAGEGIRVNAVCPGGVSTPMNAHEPEGGGVIPRTPLGRNAHVAEVSGAVAFLASDDATFVTGTELVVDGGFLAR